MTLYGKTSATAIAVMTYLAQNNGKRCGSGEIAKARSLSRALTAKLLTQLATAGLVRGTPGPGGGYLLAQDPHSISLLAIVSLFEQTEKPAQCPFGPDWCGKEENHPCPLHDDLFAILDQNRKFLEQSRLSSFAVS